MGNGCGLRMQVPRSSAFDHRRFANFNVPVRVHWDQRLWARGMHEETAAQAWRLHLFNWLMLAAAGTALGVTLLLADLTITAGSIWIGAGFVGIYATFAWLNAKVRARKDPQVVFVLGGFAQIVLVTLIMTPFTYIAATANLPMQDQWLRSLDEGARPRLAGLCGVLARPSGARDLDRLRLHDDQVAAVHHPVALAAGTDTFGCSSTPWRFCSRWSWRRPSRRSCPRSAPMLNSGCRSGISRTSSPPPMKATWSIFRSFATARCARSTSTP